MSASRRSFIRYTALVVRQNRTKPRVVLAKSRVAPSRSSSCQPWFTVKKKAK